MFWTPEDGRPYSSAFPPTMAQEQATLFPPSAGDDARRPDPYGRDELNLIELAFTTLGRARSRKTLKTEWKGKDHKGRTRKFYKRCNSTFG